MLFRFTVGEVTTATRDTAYHDWFVASGEDQLLTSWSTRGSCGITWSCSRCFVLLQSRRLPLLSARLITRLFRTEHTLDSSLTSQVLLPAYSFGRNSRELACSRRASVYRCAAGPLAALVEADVEP